MATNMDLVSITTTLLVLYLSLLHTGNAGIIRRDVPPIAIPIKLNEPTMDQANSTNENSTNENSTNENSTNENSTNENSNNDDSTEANIVLIDKAKAKNCSIEVVAFIPFNDKAKANGTANSQPKKIIHESYPNPPVPTPPSPTLITTTKAAEVTSEPETNADGTKKWGFDDKYLASQNKYATRRNVVFDVVAGDAMAFSNYNVLGHQEVTLHRKK